MRKISSLNSAPAAVLRAVSGARLAIAYAPVKAPALADQNASNDAGRRPSKGDLLIAVDGPAASGKGTIARALARHFGLPHMDTGVLYRAVALRPVALGVAIRRASSRRSGCDDIGVEPMIPS